MTTGLLPHRVFMTEELQGQTPGSHWLSSSISAMFSHEPCLGV